MFAVVTNVMATKSSPRCLIRFVANSPSFSS